MKAEYKNRFSLLTKIAGLLSVSRSYNILLVVVAQYASCVFFFSAKTPDFSVLKDPYLAVLILCNAMIIAAGYIINHFYDREKDFVNSPKKTALSSTVSKTFILRLYLFLNFSAVLLSGVVSLRSMVFFSGFAFVLWFYSHKLKKMLFVANVSLAALYMIPFFAVLFYHKAVRIDEFAPHAVFLFAILLCMNLINDLANQKGDAIFDYPTLPVRIGEKKSILVNVFFMLCAAGAAMWVFLEENNKSAFSYYFLFAAILLLIEAAVLPMGKKKVYTTLYNSIKICLLAGLLSMPLRMLFF